MTGWSTILPERNELLRGGTVIPALPLALNEDRSFDERSERALVRYYAAAGAGGLAVAVHTTQFEIRRPEFDLLAPILELAAEAFDEATSERPRVRVAGVVGDTVQAVREAELARTLGYDAVLVSPGGLHDRSEEQLLDRSQAIGAVMPVIGFYLQEAVGGRYLSREYWRRLADQESTVAVKAAPFDRYRTLELVRGISESDRAEDVVLYTGNDDNIVGDLSTEFEVASRNSTPTVRWFKGGLLGHWAVWTRSAVETLRLAGQARDGVESSRRLLASRSAAITDSNSAIFDAANGFAGVIPGVHEVLRRQGLMSSIACLDPGVGLSPGQNEEISRVIETYPWLREENDFIDQHKGEWFD